MIEDLSKVHFKCIYCDNEFFIDTVRLSSGQQVICPNCRTELDNKATMEIGKSLKKLYELKNINFIYYLK